MLDILAAGQAQVQVLLLVQCARTTIFVCNLSAGQVVLEALLLLTRALLASVLLCIHWRTHCVPCLSKRIHWARRSSRGAEFHRTDLGFGYVL